MLQLLNDSSSLVFLSIINFPPTSPTDLMENVHHQNQQQQQVQSSPRTSPTKISEIESDKSHELKIFKTSKPIKDNGPDDRALTSSSSSKKEKKNKEEKHGFFQKFGFGSKSASVSPVKNIISIPRRSSEIHDEKLPRKIQRKNVEANEKATSSATKKSVLEKKPSSKQEGSPKLLKLSKNNDKSEKKKDILAAVGTTVEVDAKNATADGDVKVDEDDKNNSHSPISSYEDQSITGAATTDDKDTIVIPETGTESDARVSQTIIMKKRTLHEAKTEGIFLPFGNICSHPEIAHASANLDISQPQKASVSATVNVEKCDKTSQKSPNVFTSCKPSMKQTISDSFSPSKKSLASIGGSSKVSSNTTLSTTISSSSAVSGGAAPSSAPSSAREPKPQNNQSGFQGKSELDLSAPLSRLGLTMASEKPSESSLAEKLSRSFFDLTHGSQDRLQKWKNKLQTGKRNPKMSTKDLSEPPDVTFPGLSDMDSLLDWTTTDKPKFVSNPIVPAATKRVHSLGPRALHPSRSATNALNISTAFDQDVYLSEGATGMIKRGSFREANMEHRTLKPRENLINDNNNKSLSSINNSISALSSTSSTTAQINANANIHYQNMKNLQQLVQTIEGYSSSSHHHQHHRELDLPPPARILPYSGIKPQDNGIIRPIAFRPLNQNKESSSVSELIIKNRENSRSIGNLAAINSIAVTPRQRTSGILPSTSSASNLFPLVTSNSATKVTDENDYDTVPEFIDRKSDHDPSADNYSLIYNFQQHSSAAAITNNQHHRRAQSGASSAGSGGGGSGGFHYHLTGQSLTSSNSSSTTSGLPNSPPHSSSTGSSVKKSASRHSGIHITPSPSDSGIVDYETLIRDKENELTSVRNAMEQNEEVLVRVYQEKERQYRDQMIDLRQKLQASQQGEAALRQQLRQSDEHRKELQRGFENLSDEKQNLQKKCQQIERELYTIRNRFEDFVRDTKAAAAATQQQQKGFCESCAAAARRQQQQQNSSSQSKPQIIYENGSIASMGSTISGKAPIPAPRLSKENDRQLRGEVDDLRGEISSLRDQLNTQMQMFTEERRRWEQERKNRSPSPKTQFRNATQEKRTAVLLSNDRLI